MSATGCLCFDVILHLVPELSLYISFSVLLFTIAVNDCLYPSLDLTHGESLFMKDSSRKKESDVSLDYIFKFYKLVDTLD